MVITFLSESMVAPKSISAPLELSTLRVIKLSTLSLVSSELSVFLTVSLKVSVILLATATAVAEFVGLKVKVGLAVFLAVKVAEVALIAFSQDVYSTVAPIST